MSSQKKKLIKKESSETKSSGQTNSFINEPASQWPQWTVKQTNLAQQGYLLNRS